MGTSSARRMHRAGVSFGSLLLAGGLAAQQPQVSLDEAIRLAQGAVPGVVQARANLRNSKAQIRSTTGAYLPSLTASSSGGNSFSEGLQVTSGGVKQNRTNTSYNFGLSSSVDLFTGFRRGANRREARASETAAEASLTNAEYQAGLTATQQFFAALAAQQLVRVREAGVRRAEEQLKLSVAKLQVGSATRSDSLRSLVNLGNAQLAQVSAESDVAGRQAALGRTLGRDGRIAAQDDSVFYRLPEALDTAVALQEAIAQSPQVRAGDANVTAAQAAVAASRSTYWPSLALSGSIGWNGEKDSDYQLLAQRQVQLGLSWPLFNKFQREETIVNRLSSLDAAEASAADTRRQVQASLTTQFALLDAARLRIRITGTSVAAAAEDLRVVNERYRVGAATILDVLNSQEALAQAEVDVVNARFDYLNARAQIVALIGRPL